MRFLIWFLLPFLLGCENASTKTKVTQIELLSESDKFGLPIKVCLNEATKQDGTYPSRIRLETKDGYVLDRSDILIPTDEKCSYLNVYVYFNPKGMNKYMEFSNRVKQSVRPGNIKKLEIFLSDAYGTFYKKEDEFDYFIKQYE